MASHGGRASAERVVSGAGLKRIHAFLREREASDEPPLEPPASTARALEDRSSLSARALAIFIRCYGSFAGDMALTFLARGGLYVCGGIAAKLAPRFGEGDFIEAFKYKQGAPQRAGGFHPGAPRHEREPRAARRCARGHGSAP